MSEQRPSIGQMVHYVSYGTPGGEYHSLCRAAVIAEVGQWVTVETRSRASEGMRTVVQRWDEDAVALAVINPTGVFFNGAGAVACRHDEGHAPGTWHWPERVG